MMPNQAPQRPMPPGAGVAPQAPMPQQQPQPGAAGAEPDAVRGAQRVSNTEFNQQMQNILLSRIEEEGQKNPNFGQAIDNGVSKEAAIELALILPELHPIFRAMGLFDGMDGGGGGIQPRPAVPPMQGQEEPENPILRDGGAVPSRGLMG